MNQNVDVAIIGAGMAGLAVAVGLAQAWPEVRIALIDPSLTLTAPTAGTELHDYDRRVVALSAHSQRLLETLGAWQHIPAERLSRYQSMHVWDAEGTGSVTFDAADVHVPELGHIVENRQVVWALLQQAQACPNVEFIHEAAKYIDNRHDDGFTPVALVSGHQIRAKLVVGADGALSRVRQWAGLATREWDYGHQAIVATIQTEKPHQRTAWQRFRPQGPLALLPLSNPHLLSIVWSTSDEEAQQVLALDTDGFNQALTEASEGYLGKIIASTDKVSIPLRQRHAKRYWTEGVVLVGDAAHVIHPLAGQGVNLGFKDVDVLVQVITHGLAQQKDIGSAAVLSAYQRRRQADNLATMAAMEGFKRLFAAEAPLVRVLRNQGMRLFDRCLPVKQHVVMQAMGLKQGV